MKYSLFSVTGVELEYMVVDKTTLQVKPIVGELIKDKIGAIVSDVNNGAIEWSNELVAHVIEIKTNGPVNSLQGLSVHFQQNIQEINLLLQKYNACLLPTAAHPFMNPYTDTVLWQHEHSEIYDLYNKIFDCKGHGWSNLQSTHINLPFANDEEFEKLHAAIRLVLPLIPALCASSPLLDGKLGAKDQRLETYRTNQQRIPELTGRVIPEPVFTQEAYIEQIFAPIKKAIEPFDTDKVMDHHFLNSRGAIARFDRGAIEIRLIDIQETPVADVAIVDFLVACIKVLVQEKWTSLAHQKSFEVEPLYHLLLQSIQQAEDVVIDNKEYLSAFGIYQNSIIAKDLFYHILQNVQSDLLPESHLVIQNIINNGSLSTRIVKKLTGDLSMKNMQWVYNELASCLNENKLFS